ncbi:hypothetical protein [Dongshaea marina]|uniref:hypothetical protein n=1 Tax=Dongshaea marina TaxID=2047966 RepID=UPI00131EE6A9|nr:hypothetical protein [Dongshaea marina]
MAGTAYGMDLSNLAAAISIEKLSTDDACPKISSSPVKLSMEHNLLSMSLDSLTLDLRCKSSSAHQSPPASSWLPPEAPAWLQWLPDAKLSIQHILVQLPHKKVRGTLSANYQGRELTLTGELEHQKFNAKASLTEHGWRLGAKLPTELISLLAPKLQLTKPLKLDAEGTLSPLQGSWQLGWQGAIKYPPYAFNAKSDLGGLLNPHC